MKFGFFAPKGAVDNKPPHGQPCNRCGLCCQATLCPLAQVVFNRGVTGPCPALSRDEDGFAVCGLVADPGAFALAQTLKAGGREKAGAAAVILIGSGTGCDARMNGEPGDERFYETLRQWDRDHRKETAAAKKIWGIR